MIAYIDGKLLEKSPEHAVVMCNGIGYRIEIPLTAYYQLPDLDASVTFYVSTVVREDSIRLFGFKQKSEKQLFDVLLQISRIGPKLALNILSGMEFEPLKKAIITQDVAALASIPGLGKKTAERLLFEIKDKVLFLGEIRSSNIHEPEDAAPPIVEEAVSVLVNLGYKRSDSETAVTKAFKTGAANIKIQELIRSALKTVSGRKQS